MTKTKANETESLTLNIGKQLKEQEAVLERLMAERQVMDTTYQQKNSKLVQEILETQGAIKILKLLNGAKPSKDGTESPKL